VTSGLTGRTLRGVVWTLPTSLVSRAVGLVGTLILARFLTPAEYGEVTAASIVAMTTSTVTTLGIGTYLVSSTEASRDEIFHAALFFIGTGVLAVAAMLVLAGPVGSWTDTHLERFIAPLH
jgi:lipopolysaccharide exporter